MSWSSIFPSWGRVLPGKMLHGKNKLRILATGFFLPALLLLSCGKEELPDTVQTQTLEGFHTIDVRGVYDIALVQDTVNAITITGYEKPLGKTTVSISDSVLTLETGGGTGQFLHPKRGNTKVELHVKNLRRINVLETCSISTLNALGTGSDEIGIVVGTKLTDIDLELACKTFYYWNDPSAVKMKLRGHVQQLKLWNSGLGQVDAQNLQADYVLCDNGSQGECRVSPLQQLEYSISNKGNIYYYGSPAQITEVRVESGSGQLIKVN